MALRHATTPLSINATSTHDTKRGEDVRARLNVLTDLPKKWRKLVIELQKNSVNKNLKLHKNDIYLIYQTLLGAIPFEQGEKGIAERLANYVEKALREAKKRSDWASPNQAYENAAKDFSVSLVDDHQTPYKLIHSFLNETADYAILNSLSQLLLKFTCPGIPDIYQGTELWDLSLVDPDNRRPVDYLHREKWLKEINKNNDLEQLWDTRYAGRIKLWLTQLLLKLRGHNQQLFEHGKYIPIKVKGKFKKHVLAFLRHHQEQWILVAIPLGLAKINNTGKSSRELDWEDTKLVLPSHLPMLWDNRLTNHTLQKAMVNESILVNELFDQIPLAVLIAKTPQKERGSGILLHITSLPAPFGIGDLGPKAYEFVDFLTATHQKYWQLLPLNPTGATTGYSPYSASSAIAGNVLLISPEFLVLQHLLDQKLVDSYKIKVEDSINFKQAEQAKLTLLKAAYKNFISTKPYKLQNSYSKYIISEKAWLDDFVLFTALRNHHKQMPWTEWPEHYKLREPQALIEFATTYASEIDELKWQQFIFYKQWTQLKAYANSKNIKLIGDLPFYVAHDSVDVWANTKYFKLNEDLSIGGIAGVPPDDFNKDGQVWGMPVFNWESLKKDNYNWWMIRLKENLCLFDILRLDHFRAFDSYWEVPVKAETAIDGKWNKGPGASFFKTVAKEFAELPFIVEDLGSEMEGPEKLRDEIKLPGMKVLQFAFGDDMPLSPHLPHNYTNGNVVVYTGTHDNNTTVGWYKNELNTLGRQRLNLYAGQAVDEKNVHQIMIRLALASDAKIAIIPMQDVLGLDNNTRMNTPATTTGNWLWRMDDQEIPKAIKVWLKQQTQIFGRG